jgi:CheY-like chemotaxis protein
MTQSEFNLLIIDDDQTYTKALKFSLEMNFSKIKLTTAIDGKTGLEHIERNGFHIVLLDLVMPGLNGAQVLEQIRIMGKNYIIIVLTAYAKHELLEQARKEKPDAIYDKAEFKIEELEPFLKFLKTKLLYEKN